MDYVGVSQAMIAQAMDTARTPCLWASGERDGNVLMHLLQPYAARLTIIHNAVDTAWPGTTMLLCRLAEAWGFRPPLLVHPPLTFDDYVTEFGYPVEVVPSTMDAAMGSRSPWAIATKASSWWHCTLTRIIVPVVQATMDGGYDVVLTGSRASDAPAYARLGAVTDARPEAAFCQYKPLHHWTTAQVQAYVESQTIALPPQYAFREKGASPWPWPQCMRCTRSPQHWQFLREHFPEFRAQYWPEVKAVYQTVSDEAHHSLGNMQQVLQAGD